MSSHIGKGVPPTAISTFMLIHFDSYQILCNATATSCKDNSHPDMITKSHASSSSRTNLLIVIAINPHPLEGVTKKNKKIQV
jgi:hypothetical protein